MEVDRQTLLLHIKSLANKRVGVLREGGIRRASLDKANTLKNEWNAGNLPLCPSAEIDLFLSHRGFGEKGKKNQGERRHRGKFQGKSDNI